jgi:hypothetical protein
VKKIIYFLVVLNMAIETQAQSAITGEYYLRGVMETASGFLLKPDSTFEFFFSYGALDRGGSGKWTIKGNEIVLNSKSKPVHDFALVDSKAIKDDSITIKITDDNIFLVRYVSARLRFADAQLEAMSNEKGEIKFPTTETKTLSLVFEFCPEKISLFELDKSHNYFEFRFEPWITEFFFTDFHLKLDGKDLKGKHPLLDDKEYRFEKRK